MLNLLEDVLVFTNLQTDELTNFDSAHTLFGCWPVLIAYTGSWLAHK